MPIINDIETLKKEVEELKQRNTKLNELNTLINSIKEFITVELGYKEKGDSLLGNQ